MRLGVHTLALRNNFSFNPPFKAGLRGNNFESIPSYSPGHPSMNQIRKTLKAQGAILLVELARRIQPPQQCGAFTEFAKQHSLGLSLPLLSIFALGFGSVQQRLWEVGAFILNTKFFETNTTKVKEAQT